MKPLTVRARLAAVLGAACLVAVSLCAVSITNAQSPSLDVEAVQKQNAALSNARQIGLAMLQYAQDYDETFPPASRWMDVTKPYLRNVEALYGDPAAPNQKFGFAFNRALSGKKVTRLQSPGEVVAIFSSTSDRRNASDNGESLPRPGRHSGGNIYVFGDGRAKYLPDAARPSFTPAFKPAASQPHRVEIDIRVTQALEKALRKHQVQADLNRAVAGNSTNNARLQQVQAELARTKAELARVRAELARSRGRGSVNQNGNTGQSEQMEAIRTAERAILVARLRQLSASRQKQTAERALIDFKQHHNGELPEAQPDDGAQLMSLKAQLANMQIVSADAALRQAVLVQQMAKLGSMSSLPDVSAMDKVLNELRSKRNALLRSGKMERHPSVQALTAQIAAMLRIRSAKQQNVLPQSARQYQSLKTQLQEAQIAQTTMNRQMQALQIQIAQYQARAKQLPKSQQQLSALQREYGGNKAQFDRMLAQREDYVLKLKLEEQARKAGTPQ